MNKKIENEATLIVLEAVGVLGIGQIVNNLNADSENETEKGYQIINYLFKNIRKVKPQIEELINVLIEEDVSIIKGIKLMKDDKEVVNFFTELFNEVM